MLEVVCVLVLQEYVSIVGDYVPSSDAEIPSRTPLESDVDVEHPEKEEGLGESEYNRQREEAAFSDQLDQGSDLAGSDRTSTGGGIGSERSPDLVHADEDSGLPNQLPDEPHNDLTSSSESPSFTDDLRPSWPSSVLETLKESLVQSETVTPLPDHHHPPEESVTLSTFSLAGTSMPEASILLSPSSITTSESAFLVHPPSDSVPFPEQSSSHVPPPVQSPVMRENDESYRQELPNQANGPHSSEVDHSFVAAAGANPSTHSSLTPGESPVEEEIPDHLSPVEDVQKWRQEQLDRYSRESFAQLPPTAPSPAVPEPVQRWRREQLERESAAHTFAQAPDYVHKQEEHHTTTEEEGPEYADSVASRAGDSFPERGGLPITEDEQEESSNDSPHVSHLSDGKEPSSKPHDDDSTGPSEKENDEPEPFGNDTGGEDEEAVSPAGVDSGAHEVDQRLEGDINQHSSHRQMTDEGSEEANEDPRHGENTDGYLPQGEATNQHREDVHGVPIFDENAHVPHGEATQQWEGVHEELRHDANVDEQLPHGNEDHLHKEEEDGDEDVDKDSLFLEEISQVGGDDSEDGDSEEANGVPILSNVDQVHPEKGILVERPTFTDVDPSTQLSPTLTDTPPPAQPHSQQTQVFFHSTAETQSSTVPVAPPPSIPNPEPELAQDQYHQVPPSLPGEDRMTSASEQQGKDPFAGESQPHQHDTATKNTWDSLPHAQDGRYQEDTGNSEQPPTPPAQHSHEAQPPEDERYDPSHFRLPPHSFSFEEEGVADCPPCPPSQSSLHGITEHVATALPPWIGEWLLAQVSLA